MPSPADHELSEVSYILRSSGSVFCQGQTFETYYSYFPLANPDWDRGLENPVYWYPAQISSVEINSDSPRGIPGCAGALQPPIPELAQPFLVKRTCQDKVNVPRSSESGVLIHR